MMPSKGQASSRVTLWIASDLTHVQVGSEMASPSPLSVVFSTELLAKTPQASFPLIHSDGLAATPQTWLGGLTRLQALSMYNNSARKHRVVRGV
jgi:hypothetical protein